MVIPLLTEQIIIARTSIENIGSGQTTRLLRQLIQMSVDVIQGVTAIPIGIVISFEFGKYLPATAVRCTQAGCIGQRIGEGCIAKQDVAAFSAVDGVAPCRTELNFRIQVSQHLIQLLGRRDIGCHIGRHVGRLTLNLVQNIQGTSANIDPYRLDRTKVVFQLHNLAHLVIVIEKPRPRVLIGSQELLNSRVSRASFYVVFRQVGIFSMQPRVRLAIGNKDGLIDHIGTGQRCITASAMHPIECSLQCRFIVGVTAGTQMVDRVQSRIQFSELLQIEYSQAGCRGIEADEIHPDIVCLTGRQLIKKVMNRRAQGGDTAGIAATKGNLIGHAAGGIQHQDDIDALADQAGTPLIPNQDVIALTAFDHPKITWCDVWNRTTGDIIGIGTDHQQILDWWREGNRQSTGSLIAIFVDDRDGQVCSHRLLLNPVDQIGTTNAIARTRLIRQVNLRNMSQGGRN